MIGCLLDDLLCFISVLVIQAHALFQRVAGRRLRTMHDHGDHFVNGLHPVINDGHSSIDPLHPVVNARHFAVNACHFVVDASHPIVDANHILRDSPRDLQKFRGGHPRLFMC